MDRNAAFAIESILRKGDIIVPNKVRWGVLGAALIAVGKVIPAMQKGEWSEVTAIASRDRKGGRGRGQARNPEGLRIL